MKKRKVVLVSVCLLSLMSCNRYMRIGDLNMVSNRNIDSSKKYVLVARGVEAVGKNLNDDALENAIDKATNENNGEYIMNVSIYIKPNGKKVKVIGDIWAIEEENAPKDNIVSNGLNIGDTVNVKLMNKKIATGRLVAHNKTKNIYQVEYKIKKDKKKVDWFYAKDVYK